MLPVIAQLNLPLLEDVLRGWPSWAVLLIGLAAVVAIASIVLEAVMFIILLAARRTSFDGDETMVRRIRPPLRVGLPFLVILLMRPALQLPEYADVPVQRLLAVCLIGILTWLIVRIVNALVKIVLSRHNIEAADNLEARRVHTQLRVIARIVTVTIGVIGTAAMLMIFPSIRQLGTSLLASAGIAGLIIGLAAQKTIGNLLAGLQIALTGSINLDDVVIIDDEWGRIEEITSTYVVVRIWDDRRLIVPFSRVIDQSFQNWTRRTASILGTVFIHADYTVDVDALRREVQRIAGDSEHWDGRVAQVVVTEATQTTLQLRALISAADASKAWNLRCEVREQLIDYLQRESPEALPRYRSHVRICDPDRSHPNGDGSKTDAHHHRTLPATS